MKVKSVLERRDEKDFLLYQGARITSKGIRTIEEQIKFVKERPTEYPATLKKFCNEKGVDHEEVKKDARLTKNIYHGHEEWLKRTIKSFAEKGIGFKHLSGGAIDISVKSLKEQDKKMLFNDLIDIGLYVLLEKVDGTKSKYNVSIYKANVFHIEEKKGRTQNKYPIIKLSEGGIWI